MAILCEEIDCTDVSEFPQQTGKARWQSDTIEGGFRRSDFSLISLCVPFVVLGILFNVLVLWVWSTLATHYCHSVYLFKTLALADIFYLGGFLPVRFYVFTNDHGDLFLRILTYGNQVVGIYASLILALVRFTKAFCPRVYRRCMSPFQLKMFVALNLFCSLSLQTLYSSSYIFMAEGSAAYLKAILKKGAMIFLPAFVQMALMVMVLFKLWFRPSHRPSKLTASTLTWLQAMSDKDNQDQLGTSSSFQLDNSDLTSDDPRCEPPSWHGEGTAPPRPAPAARAMDASRGSTRRGSEPQHSSVVFTHLPVSAEKPGESDVDRRTAEARTALHQAAQEGKEPREPMSSTQDFTDKNVLAKSTRRKSSLRKTSHYQSPTSPGRGSGRRRVSFATESGTLIKPFETKLLESDHRTDVVVFAICCTTFLAYPVCIGMSSASVSLSPHYACYVMDLLNSGVKFFFYLFITCFKNSLNSRGGKFMQKVLPLSSG